MSKNKWSWEKLDPNHSSSSGDLSKLFRNENIKQPGFLATDELSPTATFLAREVIQNSWDSAIERRENTTGGTPFDMRFTFGSTLSEKSRSELGLQELVDRLDDMEEDTRDIGLANFDWFKTQMMPDSKIPYLRIDESGTTGMDGPWHEDKSKMYLALASVAINRKKAGTGGSYGFGKSGMIQGSALRVVVAYTCFKEREDDPNITRRLLGMAYWGQHRHDDKRYIGFGRFGLRKNENEVVPFVNEHADQIASRLGIPHRDPSNPESIGTSFLLIQPTTTPEELVKAIERHWWPALEGQLDFNATVYSSYGEELNPRPKRNHDLRPFIDAYEHACSPSENQRDYFDRQELRAIDDEVAKPGVLALKADVKSWSYPKQTGGNDNSTIDHRSLVALVRKPRMVVEYLDVGRAMPYVRGIFIADDSIDKLLCGTEPKEHDAWQTTTEEFNETAKHAAKIAETILTRVKRRVNVFRKSLKPSEDHSRSWVLPEWDRAMRALFHGTAPTRPISQKRPYSIHVNYEIEPIDGEYIKTLGKASVALLDGSSKQDQNVSISIEFVLKEDNSKNDPIEISVHPPLGFKATNGDGCRFTGCLEPDVRYSFKYETTPYFNQWTGEIRVNVEQLKENIS